MNDLVIGTFGRGIYVLDDYSPLRHAEAGTLAQEGRRSSRCATRCCTSRRRSTAARARRSSASRSTRPTTRPSARRSPTHLKEALKTRKQKRKDAEKAAEKAGEPIPYPTPEELRAEAEEESPAVLPRRSRDADGNVVRTVSGPTGEGMHRVTWDLRDPGATLPSPACRAADDDETARGRAAPGRSLRRERTRRGSSSASKGRDAARPGRSSSRWCSTRSATPTPRR